MPKGLRAAIWPGPMATTHAACRGAGARLVHTFWAGSHLEAMTYDNRFIGREPYMSLYPDLDSQSYPEEWREVQDRAGIVET
jgi:hypothetical protein